MSSRTGRTRKGASTRPWTSAWNANVSFGHGEKPNASSRILRQLREEPRQGARERGQRVVEAPPRAVGLADRVRDRAQLDGGNARELGGAEDAEALHGLDVAAARPADAGRRP